MIVFADPGAKIRHKKGDEGGCKFTRSRHRATCELESGNPINVLLGDRNDSVRFKGRNEGKLGPQARTEVKVAPKLAEDYRDSEGANLEHALILGGPGNDSLRGTDSSDTIDGGPVPTGSTPVSAPTGSSTRRTARWTLCSGASVSTPSMWLVPRW